MDREIIKVRILENGMAREVNPLGDDVPPYSTWEFMSPATSKEAYKNIDAWREAESNCRTLPWDVNDNTADAVSFSGNYYAYIESDHFILVKPVTDK